MGEILSEEELPLKTVGLSSCFRREAGAAGKDTYGLYRIHQFDKVEQVVVCRNDVEESNKYHAEILANSEGVLKALGLPYRVVIVCTGDLGRGQAKKFDIETWMPSREQLRRNAQRQQVLRVPGPPDEPALQGPQDQEERLLPHAEQHGDRLARAS